MEWLFDSTPFVPRWNCGQWDGWLGYTYIVSNSITFICYNIIALLLLLFLKKRYKGLPTSWNRVIICFVCFTSLCGMTHYFEAMMFYYPIYRMTVFGHTMTAIVTIVTLVLFPSTMRQIAKFKSSKEYEEIQKQLQIEINNREEIVYNIREINHDLAGKIQHLQNLLQVQGWLSASQVKLNDLKQTVTSLREQYNVVGTRGSGAGDRTDQTAP